MAPELRDQTESATTLERRRGTRPVADGVLATDTTDSLPVESPDDDTSATSAASIVSSPVATATPSTVSSPVATATPSTVSLPVATATPSTVSSSVATATSAVGSWWRSRFGRQLLFEIAICGGLLMLYRSIRLVTKTDLRTAFSNASDIVAFESWLGLPFEDNLQQFLLDHPTIIQGLNYYYVGFHFSVAVALLVWLYLRHPLDYRLVRNLMAFVTFFALVIHLVYPLAPPRMMNGFVDTMARFGPNIYPPSAFDGAANQIAAMPSLHFGWAVIEAWAVIVVLSSRWRWLILIHPVLMTMAIIATANHWWIDAAAAGLIVVLGILLGRAIKSWAGDRYWSWRALRFQTFDGLERLEAHANEPRDELCQAHVVTDDDR